MVEAAPPAVGPEPASREASSFVTFSISAVHCPALAVAMGKVTRIQVPNINAVVFMAVFSGLRLRKAAPRANSGVSISIDETSRRSVGPSAVARRSNRAHIGDQHWKAALLGQHDIADVFQRSHNANATDIHRLSANRPTTTRRHERAGRHRVFDRS